MAVAKSMISDQKVRKSVNLKVVRCENCNIEIVHPYVPPKKFPTNEHPKGEPVAGDEVWVNFTKK